MFNELLIYCKLKAIENLLTPTEDTLWRSFCRSYSERWSVPLPQVRQMDPAEVILEVLEAKYEDVDAFEEIEGLLEDILKIENPDYDKEQKIGMEGFIKNIEQKEKKRLKSERERDEKRAASLKQQPKGGSVNFGNMGEDK